MRRLFGLHRSETLPQWQTISPKKRNVWQRVAHATSGLVTPGNLITLIGFCLVIVGLLALLVDRFSEGIILIVIGRSADIFDGLAAEYTGTKSPLGEALDAGLDKVATILMIVVLYVTGLVPWIALTLLLLPHLFIAAVSLLAMSRGSRLHPSRAGKISMATAWVCLVGFVVMHAASAQSNEVLAIMLYGLVIVSVALGTVAVKGYAAALRTVR